jgi:hypothetical protein
MISKRTLSALVLLCAAAQGQEIRRAIPIDPVPPVIITTGAPSPATSTPVPVATPAAMATPVATPLSAATPLPAPASWDSRAKFLAGYPLASGDPLAFLQQAPDGRTHAVELENLWARFNEHHFLPMREWSAAELAPRLSMTVPVFYFFGGPDAISPLAYFPSAPDYILGGLEPVGVVPDPRGLAPDRLAASLENLRKATNVILSFGFFITKDMKTDLENTEFKGVTPILLTFLAMSGSEVVDVTPFGVRPDGSVQDGPASGKGLLPGVRITFRQTPTSSVQRIHYVQANVANEAVASGGLLKWTAGFGLGNVYFKAASYLLHEAYFSRIRGFLLGQARAVLQDDSGIPFSFFQDGQWRLWYFGTYSGTLDIFKQYRQPTLETAFQNAGVPLPFGTGYKWRVGQSNLLLAVRQAPPKAEAIVPSPPQ